MLRTGKCTWWIIRSLKISFSSSFNFNFKIPNLFRLVYHLPSYPLNRKEKLIPLSASVVASIKMFCTYSQTILLVLWWTLLQFLFLLFLSIGCCVWSHTYSKFSIWELAVPLLICFLLHFLSFFLEFHLGLHTEATNPLFIRPRWKTLGQLHRDT